MFHYYIEYGKNDVLLNNSVRISNVNRCFVYVQRLPKCFWTIRVSSIRPTSITSWPCTMQNLTNLFKLTYILHFGCYWTTIHQYTHNSIGIKYQKISKFSAIDILALLFISVWSIYFILLLNVPFLENVAYALWNFLYVPPCQSLKSFGSCPWSNSVYVETRHTIHKIEERKMSWSKDDKRESEDDKNVTDIVTLECALKSIYRKRSASDFGFTSWCCSSKWGEWYREYWKFWYMRPLYDNRRQTKIFTH